jgi:hypothetical protein
MSRVIVVDFSGTQASSVDTKRSSGTTEQSDPAKNYQIRLRQLSTYAAKKVAWEWEPYIPKGMITIMTGDPGSLKSYLALAICANVTIGTDMSGRRMKGGNCIYLTNENDPETVVRPRFDALGGDSRHLFLHEGSQRFGTDCRLSLSDVDMLEEMLKGIPDCRILVIDPIQSYLGSGVDAWRSNQTRPLLDSLSRLTRQYQVSTIVIRHARKSGASRAIHKGLDSIDFTGAARSELLVGSSADGKQRAMVHIKSNVGRLGPPVAFEIQPGGQAGLFHFLGESTLTAADLSAPEKTRDSALDEAKEFLKEMLFEGQLPFEEIDKERKIRGIAHKTLCRAKKDLDVRSTQQRDGEGRRHWVWRLESDGQSESE